MTRETGKLTTLAVKSAKPGKHFDGNGLYVEVTPSGSRLWRLKYRFAGREKRLSYGAFPEVGIAEARQRATKARALLRDGIDPGTAKSEKAAETKRLAEASFPIVASSWLETMRPSWADETYRKAAYILDSYLVPALRKSSVATLTTKEAANALKSIPSSLAIKARGYLGRIADFATQQGLRDDGRTLVLRGVLARVEKGHIPAVTDLTDVRALVKAIDDYPITVTRAALIIAMLTAQRPGTVARMEWNEVDLETGEWSIPAAKMKTRHAHIVPLSKQALQTLRGMLIYSSGKKYVFPPLYRQNTPHLHRDSLSNALRKMGFAGKHATHGFRGMFRTVARERLNIPADVLEAQLAHAKKDEIQKAYDRTQFLDERKYAVQRWADYLDSLCSK